MLFVWRWKASVMEVEKSFPPIMTTPEAAAYLAGREMGAKVNVSEFIRFAEHFALKPIDSIGGGSRNKGETTVRQKWSKKQIDLILLTGQPLRDSLKWAQGVTFKI